MFGIEETEEQIPQDDGAEVVQLCCSIAEKGSILRVMPGRECAVEILLCPGTTVSHACQRVTHAQHDQEQQQGYRTVAPEPGPPLMPRPAPLPLDCCDMIHSRIQSMMTGMLYPKWAGTSSAGPRRYVWSA